MQFYGETVRILHDELNDWQIAVYVKRDGFKDDDETWDWAVEKLAQLGWQAFTRPFDIEKFSPTHYWVRGEDLAKDEWMAFYGWQDMHSLYDPQDEDWEVGVQTAWEQGGTFGGGTIERHSLYHWLIRIVTLKDQNPG